MQFPQLYQGNADLSTGLLFIRAYNKWHGMIKDKLKEAGITLPQFVVMTTLWFLSQENEFVTQAQIAKLSDMDVMTVSQVLRGLEKNGYLERFPNPKDVRANAVQLLQKGYEVAQQAFPLVVGIDEEFFGVLKEDEGVFREFLKLLL